MPPGGTSGRPSGAPYYADLDEPLVLLEIDTDLLDLAVAQEDPVGDDDVPPRLRADQHSPPWSAARSLVTPTEARRPRRPCPRTG